ncbi:PolC-type DNA polymerase III [Methanobrevibacter sp.]|uniref:3'-5' exonuclease n=1 Tax=Methanobrevibacter sp. TaxID=66852 RepID=UPI0025D3AEB8|nr:3'-5' exonuclease [Methanobrevibacter sp.]MBR4446918.1 3'-5' exonuclease [Methanobrevibacter sp.]
MWVFIIKIIFFDTETSGLDCRDCQIIELAMLTVEDGVITDDYNEFVNIGRPISPRITEITSITNEMLRNDGLDERTIAEDIADRLTPGTLMIAHNCQFDLLFVYFLLKRHFPEEADEIVSNVDWLDTLTVLKDRKEYPHKLIDAVNHYGIEEVHFHREIDDTKALRDVAIALRNERDDLAEYINIFGFNPKYGVGGPRFPFIEYKAQYFTKFMVRDDRILPRM